MKKVILFCVSSCLLAYPVFAQDGDVVKVKTSPQQLSTQEIIGKVEYIRSAFAGMPLNSGKLEFIKAALPLLDQVKSISEGSLQDLAQGKPADPVHAAQINGLLDQVKSLIGGKYSSGELTSAQVPDANNQVQQFSKDISDILGKESGSLKY